MVVKEDFVSSGKFAFGWVFGFFFFFLQRMYSCTTLVMKISFNV